ncbi:MAG: hypothetical protein PHE53_13085 [Thermoguttaceae bacterium]|nr:hypothetical protein [Thermoguttaceae bacterium]
MRRFPMTIVNEQLGTADDERWLDAAEKSEKPQESIRFRESPQLEVVLGRSGSLEAELDAAACERDGVPIVRRSSGGGTVLLGPGCLVYAMILDRTRRLEWANIESIHHEVLERMIAALAPLVRSTGWMVRAAGTCDLVLQAIGQNGAMNRNQTVGQNAENKPSSEYGQTVEQKRIAVSEQPTESCPFSDCRKFSGNAVRLRRRAILYHGTILYDFPLARMSRYLKSPPRQPAYRNGRSHTEFVVNFPVSRDAILDAVSLAFDAKNNENGEGY